MVISRGRKAFQKVVALSGKKGVRWAAVIFVWLAIFSIGSRLYMFAMLPANRLENMLSVSWLAKSASAQSLELVACSALVVLFGFLTEISRRRWLWVLLFAIIALAAITIVMLNLASAETISAFGSPLTLGMIVYSDLLFSENGRLAVASWIPATLLEVTALCASLAAAATACIMASRFVAAVAVIGGAVVAFVATANLVLNDNRANPMYTESATLAFFSSLRALDGNAGLGRGPARDPFARGPMNAPMELHRSATSRIKNVILIVLESAGAEYLDSYGGHYGITPELVRLAPSTIRAQNAYANAASSTLSMTVMLSSRQPSVGLKSSRPTSPMLPAVLVSAGIKTGFFHSSDTRYADTAGLLKTSGFQHIRDFRGRRCSEPLIEDFTEFNSQGTKDSCTFAEMKGWIAAAGGPFFATLWTFQSHYPYFPSSDLAQPWLPPKELADDDWTRKAKTRYLTALHEADQEIGRLIEFLKREKMQDNTLVIVTGDHGQAFRQHGQFGHGGSLHEEAVHVPMFFINSAPPRSTQFDRIVSHLDLAPTIADSLGVRVPPQWEGISMLRPSFARPAFFSTPWTDLVVGYREADRKVIARLLAQEVSIYDLGIDPKEQRDLAAGDAEIQRSELRKIQAWARSLQGSKDLSAASSND